MKRNVLMQLRSLMMAMTLAGAFVLGGCVMEEPQLDAVSDTALESTAAPASQEAVQPGQDGFETEAVCPLRWTCDSVFNYYSTQSACITACGADPCYRDYDCRGACLCP